MFASVSFSPFIIRANLTWDKYGQNYMVIYQSTKGQQILKTNQIYFERRAEISRSKYFLFHSIYAIIVVCCRNRRRGECDPVPAE